MPLRYNFGGIEGAAFASTHPTDTGGQTVQKLSGIWGGAGSESYSRDAFDFSAMKTANIETYFDISPDPEGALGQVDSFAADMDSHVFEVQYQTAADDAASSLQSSMGF